MPEEDWPIEEEYAATVDLPEWAYAGNVASLALIDYLHGSARLEPAINSVFGETGNPEDPVQETFSEEKQENRFLSATHSKQNS